MALEGSFELLMEILNRYQAGFMQDAVDFHPVIGMRARTSCGRHHEATASRAQLLEVGDAVMLVAQQKAGFHGEFLEEARSLEVISRIGGCALGHEGHPDAPRRADQVQFPAIYPAVPARCGPVDSGINRNMRGAA